LPFIVLRVTPVAVTLPTVSRPPLALAEKEPPPVVVLVPLSVRAPAELRTILLPWVLNVVAAS